MEQDVGARRFQCAVIFFLALPLCAADTTLRGRVEDEDNAPVAGAAISLRSAGQPSAPTPTIQAETDVAGGFQLTVPQPGPYLITVSKTGFFALTDRAVDVATGAPEIAMVLNHIRNTSQSVNVSAAPSPIDTEETDAKRTLTGPQIFEVPYPSTHDLRNALTLMPGVVEGPGGNLHFNGGAENQVQYMLNGFNISDPITGTFSAHLPVDAVQSIDFLNSRYSPEFGKGSSGALSIRTESGDDTWRYGGTNFIPGVDTSGGLHIGA
jgi:hypothetical protein